MSYPEDKPEQPALFVRLKGVLYNTVYQRDSIIINGIFGTRF
ncbi:MAG: hypothetical protein LBP56_07140 [Odoribacteraceae bacterium]|nr:hypothetical protein [Odoribacteraceae bacterium]